MNDIYIFKEDRKTNFYFFDNTIFTPALLLLLPSHLGCLLLTWCRDQTLPRLCPGRYQLRSAGRGCRLKHVSLLPTFICSQVSSQAYPAPPHPCLLSASPSSRLCFPSHAGGRVAFRDKPETQTKKKKRGENRRGRTLRDGDSEGGGEKKGGRGEKEKCTLYFSNGWEMIRWDLLTIIRWGLINSDHSQRGEGWSPSTKEQTVGGRYLRKRRPGVSNMRQHSPPNTLHLSIWPLSELISWRIKTNRRDPMASGCLRRTLPRLSSPRGMRLTDKGHCVGHLHRHTPHLPCHVVQFDEVICWGRTWFDHQPHSRTSALGNYRLLVRTERLPSNFIIIIHRIISTLFPWPLW